MKFYKKDGKMFVEQKRSKLRVGLLGETLSGQYPGRVIKMFVVQQVLRGHPNNPIEDGKAFALAFPSDKANASSYEWPKGQPAQVEGMTITLR